MLYRCVDGKEQLQIAGKDQPEATAGTLAAAIIQTTNGLRVEAAVRRLTVWADQTLDDREKVAPMAAGKALRAIQAQLRDWFEDGRLQWKPEYSELDPHDGPTGALSSPSGRRLLRAIEWRGPDVVEVTLPESVVLLSAVYGVLNKTLVACVKCGRLTVIAPNAAKRRACPGCGARRRDRLAPSVQKEYTRAYDRVRNSPRLRTRPEEQNRLWREIGDVRDANQNGKLSAPEAVKRIREIVPIGPRGRPRH
jgi:DNA-directed RNA polymerase subunit RPC12/RpoP